ncbi:DUF2891 domain-containing protein [Muricoccus radiodurans]|uniref:DUF2891 domain-containing protein n=1 Tax=Muricoccus radiodurans TaxID=2231721 RepID=UPI003CF242BA
MSSTDPARTLDHPEGTASPAALTEELAARLARIALGHVEQEYPHKPGHVMATPEDARTPAALHPVFHGSYDWHSCVHGYWMLARVLRRFPGMEPAAAIRALFDRRLTPEKVAGECATLSCPGMRGFERPYGWGWLLKLSAELSHHADQPWGAALAPMAAIFVGRFRDFLPVATYPVRVGTHPNTAFGLRLAADHAEAAGDEDFLTLLRDTATRWYGGDRAAPAWGEPSGDDFLSSTLIEAECMHRLLPGSAFRAWFARFLPDLEASRPATLFAPATVTDRSDGKIAHLDGLNLSRAWCWRSVAAALLPGDPRRTVMEAAAARHLAAGLPHVAGHYMGEHWLASFAVLALDE